MQTRNDAARRGAERPGDDRGDTARSVGMVLGVAAVLSVVIDELRKLMSGSNRDGEQVTR